MNAESSSCVLLVPGSWHGAWAYDAVADRLTHAGVAVTAIDLPSNDGAAGLADDAAAVRAALDGIGAPTVVRIPSGSPGRVAACAVDGQP